MFNKIFDNGSLLTRLTQALVRLPALLIPFGLPCIPPVFAQPQADLISQEKPPIYLGQGEQRLIRIPGFLKFSLGSPAVRAIALAKNIGQSDRGQRESLLLKGMQPGLSDLWVWKRDGTVELRTIRVEKISSASTRRNSAWERALDKLQEVEILLFEKGAVLRGKVLTLAESARVSALVHGFPKEIRDETELSEDLLREGEAKLGQWLKSSGYQSRLRVERAGQALWIRGSIDRPSENSAIQKHARALFPLVNSDIEALPDHAPTVYFRVFLLELRKNQFHSIGLSWPASVEGAFQVTPGSVQNLLQIDLTLQQLEGNGSAKLLSNPELVVRAPGEAELFAGGELPIQNQSVYYSNLSWKKYGLTLRLKVTHTSGDRVRLDIFTEVSHLDSTLTQDKVPGIQSNRMKTQVDARFGTPLLLSGLLQQGMREEARGIPFLRKIPVLGKLFSSEDYLNERSELVAILYPHASPPPAPVDRFPSLSPRLTPRGPIPPPRNWISPREEEELRESEDFPWNALE